jgi:FkbM family methyltransferase
MDEWIKDDVAGAARNMRYDEQTIAVIERGVGKSCNCVDVGCHVGAVLKHMLRVAPFGKHYAFEPLPHLYRGLVASFPNVRVYNLALSDSSGVAEFQHVVSNPGYSGFRQRGYAGTETIEKIQVTKDKLDHILPPDARIHFIKIDVEGGELEVLKGAMHTIRKNRPLIVFEHGLGASDYYGTTPYHVFDVLAECGMNVNLMERWLSGRPAFVREEFANAYYHGGHFYFMAHP